MVGVARQKAMSSYLGSVARLNAGVMAGDLYSLDRYISREVKTQREAQSGGALSAASGGESAWDKRLAEMKAANVELRASYAAAEADMLQDETCAHVEEAARLRQTRMKTDYTQAAASQASARKSVERRREWRSPAAAKREAHIIDVIQGKIREEMLSELRQVDDEQAERLKDALLYY